MARKSVIKRDTQETSVGLELNLDGSGQWEIATGIRILDHLLSQLAQHGKFDFKCAANGADMHHVVEDVGICLGEAFRRALGDMKGIRRYGHAVVPMIESLAAVTVDVSARPHLVYNSPLGNEKVGTFDVELVEEFLRAFAQSSGVCLHVNVAYGSNAHHTVEAVFKALGRAMSTAVEIDPRVKGVPSTKGILG